METLQEREQRIRQLEDKRAERKGEVIWPTPDDAGSGGIPIEVAPGRGDMNISSGFIPTFPTALSMLGNRTVSFARIFMSQPWVAAAVMRMLTWGVRVPLKTYRRTGDDPADRIRLRSGDHPLAAALEAPWNRAGQAQLMMQMMGPVLVHGNSVTRIDNGAGNKIEFVPKDWRFCRPIMPWRGALEGFTFDTDVPAFTEHVSIDDVLHVAWWSPIGPLGVSPLQQLGITMQIEDGAQRYQRGLFQNGARIPTAILMSDAFLSQEPADRQKIYAQLRADISALFVGPENAGKPALLPPGLDWKSNGQTTVEAALVDQRKIAREEIAAVYLIPPPLLGILERATYSNIETQRDMSYTDCLGPPLVLCEQAINSQVARDLLREPDVFCEFDFGAVLRGDRLQEIEALRAAIGTALMTPNEGRGILTLKKSDDPAMDEFYMPSNNMQPIGSPPTPNVGTVNTPDWNPDQPPDPQRGRAKRLYIKSRERDYVRGYEDALV